MLRVMPCRHRRAPHHLLALLLATVLLLGQALALAHVHDDELATHDSCALCLYAQHVDYMVSAPPVILAVSCGILSVPDVSRIHTGSPAFICYQSRAPPAILL